MNCVEDRGLMKSQVREPPLGSQTFAVAQPLYLSEAAKTSSVAFTFWARSSASALLSGSR